MITVNDIYNAVDEIAPFRYAEKSDNSGLIIGNKKSTCKKVLLCLDITDKMIDKAIKMGADVIISHHPVIFNPLKSISSDSIYAKLIKHNISAICAHTNLDMAKGGINDLIAEKLNVKVITECIETAYEIPYYQIAVFVPVENIEQVYQAMTKAGAGTLGNYSGCAFYTEGTGTFLPLEGSHAYVGEVGKRESVREARIEMILPQSKRFDVIQAMLDSHPYEKPAYNLSKNYAIMEQIGFGKIGELETEMSAKDFAEFLKKTFDNPCIRYNDTGKMIKKVAFCSGSGGSLLNYVIASGADAFVTGDVKHDQFVDADNAGLAVFDAGHFYTENIVLESLKNTLSGKFPELNIIIENSNVLSFEK